MGYLAPGYILQKMYIRKRLKLLQDKCRSFFEVGSGNGFNSKLFLEMGFHGKSVDLNDSACENNRQLNAKYISSNQYSVDCSNFLSIDFSENEKYDIIFSSMVIEHLPEDQLHLFFRKSKSLLSKKGRIIILVPTHMKFWGIEDEIAGHYRRFSYADFSNIADKHSLNLNHLAGLTYPVSNILLKLSNYLVKKSEAKTLALSKEERTILTGNRDVKFKTSFPQFFRFFLNDITMYPLFLLQNMNTKSDNAMIGYFELTLKEN